MLVLFDSCCEHQIPPHPLRYELNQSHCPDSGASWGNLYIFLLKSSLKNGLLRLLPCCQIKLIWFIKAKCQPGKHLTSFCAETEQGRVKDRCYAEFSPCNQCVATHWSHPEMHLHTCGPPVAFVWPLSTAWCVLWLDGVFFFHYCSFPINCTHSCSVRMVDAGTRMSGTTIIFCAKSLKSHVLPFLLFSWTITKPLNVDRMLCNCAAFKHESLSE